MTEENLATTTLTVGKNGSLAASVGDDSQLMFVPLRASRPSYGIVQMQYSWPSL